MNEGKERVSPIRERGKEWASPIRYLDSGLCIVYADPYVLNEDHMNKVEIGISSCERDMDIEQHEIYFRTMRKEERRRGRKRKFGPSYKWEGVERIQECFSGPYIPA
jgi:hypothetical protein